MVLTTILWVVLVVTGSKVLNNLHETLIRVVVFSMDSMAKLYNTSPSLKFNLSLDHIYKDPFTVRIPIYTYHVHS